MISVGYVWPENDRTSDRKQTAPGLLACRCPSCVLLFSWDLVEDVLTSVGDVKDTENVRTLSVVCPYSVRSSWGNLRTSALGARLAPLQLSLSKKCGHAAARPEFGPKRSPRSTFAACLR